MVATTEELQTGLRGQLALGLGVVAILGILLVSLPPFVLDPGLSVNLAIALLILMVALYARNPLELSSFPTMLLLATLYRLALNIASTRLILLNGDQGVSAAGNVIEAFGQIVVGGSFTVGIVIFALFVIINFVVITKGTGRNRRGGRALHPRRHAGQADGDRRRSQRRNHQRGGCGRAPPRDSGAGRLLRLHGRRRQVRPGRCHRRAAHHVREHPWRSRDRDTAARHGLCRGCVDVYTPDRRRRPRIRGSLPAHLRRCGYHRDAGGIDRGSHGALGGPALETSGPARRRLRRAGRAGHRSRPAHAGLRPALGGPRHWRLPALARLRSPAGSREAAGGDRPAHSRAPDRLACSLPTRSSSTSATG